MLARQSNRDLFVQSKLIRDDSCAGEDAESAPLLTFDASSARGKISFEGEKQGKCVYEGTIYMVENASDEGRSTNTGKFCP